MKFTKSALSLLFLATKATAWTTTAHGLPRGRFLVHLNAVAGISTDVVGQEKTESFRLKFKEGDKTLSPWHDIDLSNEDGSYNMVSTDSRRSSRTIMFRLHTHTQTAHALLLLFPVSLGR